MSQKSSSPDQLRLRIFAGPNGSGKSTIIKSIRDIQINGKKIDFGVYINADDIAESLIKNKFSFRPYKINPSKKEIIDFAVSSGLLNDDFNVAVLRKNFALHQNKAVSKNALYHEHIAQILARFVRECMLRDRRRFSFETVFSHESNIEVMKRATEAGYKVYLYFVSTESPEINKFRVKYRVTQKGHNVPTEKIESRYYRSLKLLFEAAENAYQCFFFDNSVDDTPFKLINHFKKTGAKKKWDTKDKRQFSNWFKKYYWDKL